MAFKLLAARDKRSVDPPSPSEPEQPTSGDGKASLIEALASELSQHHFINRFFPVTTAGSAEVKEELRPPVTFEEVEEYGDIELPDRPNAPAGDSDSTEPGSSSGRPVSVSQRLRAAPLLHVINRRQEEEFQLEKLPNPFYVAEKERK